MSEPYYSGTSFIASVANILYMIFYTVPLGYNQIIGIFLIFQRRREALAKQLEEQKWKEETRHLQIQQTEGINKMVELMGLVLAKQRDDEKEKAEARDHRIQQTEGINKMVELLGSVLQDNKALKEDKKVLCQCVERLESRMQDSEKLINGMERMVTVVQGLEGVFRVALEGVETRIGAIEHMVDWMLDYHLDENKRFHALKVILAGLLK